LSPFRASPGFTRSWEHFDFEIADEVATIRLNRPDKLNALTLYVYADLRDIMAELPHRDDVRVLVLTGTGRGFCSGGDVRDIIGALVEMDARDLLEFTRMTGAVVQRMRELPLPIIASVNGVAAGAGTMLALAADFRLLSASASFAFLFTRVGLAGADMGSAYLLPRIVGFGRATELLMLGDRISAEDALRIGLANDVVADEELDQRTIELARRLADGPHFAHAATKSLLSRELDMGLSASIELEAWTQALLMTTHDHHEFHRALQEGRAPEWNGR
jgi:enoyl-CoA hydratase/carnithine racemase